MKELEEQIIASCLFQDKFNEVSFLEPNDFTDGNPRECFKFIKESKGLDIYRLISSCQLSKECIYWMLTLEYTIIGYDKHRDLSLFLIETRFKTLFSTLLGNLSIKAKSSLERDLLNSLIMAIPSEDIFDLSDNAIEYIGVHASDHTVNKINDFISYRNKRLAEIKKVSNECS